ncbi:zinc ribbon domain-containing protein [Kitasatospora sp. MAP5-34]|uniref:NADase-type glycan-binding domain-containing protein n=1 Tax=Kitasatospora sp. MAP5-34 TaxID=3035102 RepID=UPI0024731202|nr:zinc ribbon domain-containing protein [Kitasatospora sp. MAP5-34]
MSTGDDFCGECGAFADWQADGRAAAVTLLPPDKPDTLSISDESSADGSSEADAPEQKPVAVQPGTPVVRPSVASAAVDDHVARPDDLACSACATANPAERAFCRRCGAALARAVQVARVPWWRRWWRERQRRRISRRRRPVSRLRRLVTTLLALGVTTSLVYTGVAYGPRAVTALRDRYTPPAPVHAASVRASSAAPGHPAQDAVDGTWNHYWAPAGPLTAPPQPGEWLEADFAQPFRLLDLVVDSGASDHQDEFLKQARPAELEITAWSTGGSTAQKTVRLEDKPTPQTIRWPVAGVTKIRLTVRSAYGTGPARLVALGEVEFFERS